ncbi:MAG: ribosomal protein S18-alanine N-acetyltransferase [Oscillospiraceae bacterium]|nr:ribosomal protein S18-alanine N-acetyltransferase [Oscillospiraceae bacterium]
MDYSIRKAVRDDVDAIAALERACFSLPRDDAAIDRAIGDFTVAVGAGELLGYADALTVLDEGYIGNIAVSPEQRRRGIGAALLDALLQQGREKALSFLTLEVRESNAAARALYLSRGFVVAGERRNVYERPRENALIMTYYYKEDGNIC